MNPNTKLNIAKGRFLINKSGYLSIGVFRKPGEIRTKVNQAALMFIQISASDSRNVFPEIFRISGINVGFLRLIEESS